MGRQAYKSLSDFQGGQLFAELSVCFPDLVFVLFQIRKSNSHNQYNDLLSLMDHYMETGSPYIAKISLIREFLFLLRKIGIKILTNFLCLF